MFSVEQFFEVLRRVDEAGAEVFEMAWPAASAAVMEEWRDEGGLSVELMARLDAELKWRREIERRAREAAAVG